MKSDPVIHFEIPYENAKRVSDFYTKAFGWEMKELGAEMNNYILAGTSETDENRMIKNPGQINGGLFPKSAESGDRTLLTIQVENINESMKKVAKAGGKVFGQPVPIPNVGTYVAFEDSEGNRGSMLQPPSN